LTKAVDHGDKIYNTRIPVKEWGMVRREIGHRVRALREAFGKLTPEGTLSQGDFGRMVALAVGGGPGIGQDKVSKWEAGKITRYVVATIAWVHPTDPAGCFAWLLGKRAEMPRLPVDWTRDGENAAGWLRNGGLETASPNQVQAAVDAKAAVDRGKRVPARRGSRRSA
jgi:hypothetical protein